MEKNYLSCDDLQDAMRSLSLIYGVSEHTIWDLYNQNWPDYLPEYDGLECIKLDYFNDLIGSHLGVQKFEYPDLFVAFYHRTRFDGTSDWFSPGLLDSVSGANRFIARVESMLSQYSDVENLKQKVLSNIKLRTQFEGGSVGGPYAFDWFDAAKNAPGYDVPEFLCGRFKDENGNDIYFLRDVAELLKKNLQPVIVKFLAKPRCYIQYVNGLWAYVYMKRFDYEISQQTGRTSFTSNGVSVMPEKIIECYTEFSS